MNVKLLQHYRNIQRTIKVRVDRKYKNLVHPLEAYNTNIHNWYRFKEGYSPNLANEILRQIKFSGKLKILDPFCGSGTTLLSTATNPSLDFHEGLGIEVNPFIHFVADTKLNYYKLNKDSVFDFLEKIYSCDLTRPSDSIEIPELSTIPRAFSNSTLLQLLNLKQIIRCSYDHLEYEHDFFMLGFASILESVSCMVKSGRALKITKKIDDYDVKKIYISKINNMIKDLEEIKKSKCKIPETNLKKVNIINQDIRSISSFYKNNFNAVIFSPPYLNHFDYSEVYKIELWMLDFIKDKDQFRSLRYKTFRSHPSVKFEATSIYKSQNSEIINDLIDSLEKSPRKEVFYNTIKGYIDDMYITFQLLDNITTEDAIVACIVANSLFGSVDKNNLTPVATDLLISEIARTSGFEVQEIIIARKITRRGLSFPYGRESIIILKKSKKANTFGIKTVLTKS